MAITKLQPNPGDLNGGEKKEKNRCFGVAPDKQTHKDGNTHHLMTC
jgi:hypothetical protein